MGQGQAPMQVTGEDALRRARAASGARVQMMSSPPMITPNPFALGGTRLASQGPPFRYVWTSPR